MLSTLTPSTEESEAGVSLARAVDMAEAADTDGMTSWTAMATEAGVTTSRTSSAAGNMVRMRVRKPARSKVLTSPLQLKAIDTTGLYVLPGGAGEGGVGGGKGGGEGGGGEGGGVGGGEGKGGEVGGDQGDGGDGGGGLGGGLGEGRGGEGGGGVGLHRPHVNLQWQYL
jgi:hypothetical protein